MTEYKQLRHQTNRIKKDIYKILSLYINYKFHIIKLIFSFDHNAGMNSIGRAIEDYVIDLFYRVHVVNVCNTYHIKKECRVKMAFFLFTNYRSVIIIATTPTKILVANMNL